MGTTDAEAALLAVVEDEHVDLVVLARYMRVLSPTVCARLSGRAIYIHHAMLAISKSARPYHQAHRRGVKIIGATALYVTEDRGPAQRQQHRGLSVTPSRSPEIPVKSPTTSALSRFRRQPAQAWSSISTRMGGSSSPATITIVAAGRTPPNTTA